MVFTLENRKIIKIKGSGAISFLHSLTTNNILALEPQKAGYNAILTPSSRFLCDFFVYKDDINTLIIDIFEDFVIMFIELLKKYKLRSKFDIIEENDLKIIVCTEQEKIFNSQFSFYDPRNIRLGKRYAVNRVTDDVFLTQVQYDDFLLENKITAGEWLEKDKAFILEYNFEELNCIDFNKGCYIGQELITRTKRTGEIRKELKLVDEKFIDLNTCKIIKKHSNNNLYLVLVKK